MTSPSIARTKKDPHRVVLVGREDIERLLVLSPGWISNGHWLVRRDVLIDHERFEEPHLAEFRVRVETVTDAQMERHAEGPVGAVPWHFVDGVEIASGVEGFGVLLVREQGVEVGSVQQRYWRIFRALLLRSEVRGVGPQCVVGFVDRRSGQVLAGIMPLRIGGGRIS